MTILPCKRLRFSILCLFVALVSVRCDLINSAKEYFQGSGNGKPATQEQISVPATPPAPIAVDSKQSEQKAPAANVLARVGSWTITVEEFNARLNALKEAVPDFDTTTMDAKKLVLETLVRQQLLVSEAEKAGMANQKDIEAAVEEFRRTLIVQEIVKNLVRDIKVSDEEASAFYEAQKAVLVEPAQWHLRSIIVDSQLKANELSTQLLQGADFKEIAKQNSIGDNAAQGGDLGFIAKAPFPEMQNAVASLNAGEISGVFKGPQGFYIVKVEEKKGGAPIPFEEIKSDIIKNQLMLKQQQAILDYVEKLKGQTKVEMREDLL
ncbi:MAG: peptidyl-prolyl cis-trans isomerase [Candidatus Omnitrophica bacterium]|nr:peptidyl-prolyl cis-trans isomerase [Candidatus Omnitrophota bacterium]